jgi:hypothetical protein
MTHNPDEYKKENVRAGAEVLPNNVRKEENITDDYVGYEGMKSSIFCFLPGL